MREKLIELLNKVQDMGVTVIPAGMGDTYDHVWNQEVADHLIANGVTIPVRCKDCNNFVPESITVCRHCSLTGMQVVDEDDFCSYGERRTDE
jgi:hypothetical protein